MREGRALKEEVRGERERGDRKTGGRRETERRKMRVCEREEK